MVSWINLRNAKSFAVGGTVVISYFIYRKRNMDEVFASWTNTNNPVNTCAAWDFNWDYRAPKSLVKPLKNDTAAEQNRYNKEIENSTSKATRHIILVRHGEYMDDGDSDKTHNLTQRGRHQANCTGRRIKDLGIQWDQVIVSTMTRAKETAEIILNEIDFDMKDVKHCSFIREGAPIPPQPPIGHWRPENCFFRDGARIEAGFRRYFYRSHPSETKDTYTLIVGHGNVIRYFVCRALQLPPEAWLRMNVFHGSITWISISPSGNVSLKYLGDSGFMPVKYLTNKIPRVKP